MKDNFSGGNDMWNERYQTQKNLYTTKSNFHFEQYLKDKEPGKILLPGDGEGRNGVFAAKLGWEVTTFDYSRVGLDHANELAQQEKVNIQTLHSSITEFNFQSNYFDVISIIFFHVPPEIRQMHFPRLLDFLKPKGKLFILGFNKKQIQLSSGGPKNIDMLFDKNELLLNFKNLEIEKLTEFAFDLNEGPKHQGKAELIEFIGIKR